MQKKTDRIQLTTEPRKSERLLINMLLMNFYTALIKGG